jgi:hypothetical protein
MPPFLFFLTLHITYNKHRKRHAHFWKRLEHPIDSIRNVANVSQDFRGTVRRAARALRSIPRSAIALFRR